MKFIISRKRMSVTESKKVCDEAIEEDLSQLDYRTVSTLEKAKGKVWYKEWISSGKNHREEDGMVVCDKKEKSKQWVVNLNTLEDLVAFQGKYGAIIISDSTPYKEVKKEITIL